MILLVIGLPGRFAQWCSAVVMQLASPSGEVQSVVWPPLDAMLACRKLPSMLEELGAFLVASDAGHVVVTAHQPDDKLGELVAAREIPFLLALDDPRSTVSDIAGEAGADAAQVVRALANCYPRLLPYHGLAGALVLPADRAIADPAAAVAAIARHFGVALGVADAAAITRRLPPLRGSHRSDGLSAAGVRLLDGALSPYLRHFRLGALDEIVWGRDLFLRADGGSPGEPIDAAGGARYLVYGPYIQLPPGQWTARVVLGFSPETVGSRFVVDAGTNGRQLAAVAIMPESGGLYAADLDFAIEEECRNGLEIRVMAAGDAAEGRLALGHAVLRRRSDHRRDPIDGAEDFLAALAL